MPVRQLHDRYALQVPGTDRVMRAALQSPSMPVMEPPRLPGPDSPAPPGRRPAAVLIPIYPTPDGPHVVIIRRTARGRHAGQHAFPGGRPEPDDADLQATAEESLRLGIEQARRVWDPNTQRDLRANAGAVIVLDATTGAVRAIASYPTYDPSVFTQGLTQKGYEQRFGASTGYPLFDRAIQGQYPPGSTFKPWVLLSALRRDLVRTSQTYPCPPSWHVPGDTRLFRNWSLTDLGTMSLARSLSQSCDTIYYPIGYDYWRVYYPPPSADGIAGNDLCVRENGDIYVTEPDNKQIWLVTKAGEKRVVDKAGGLEFPNGVLLSADQGLQLGEVITNRVPGVPGSSDHLDPGSTFQPDFLPVFQDTSVSRKVDNGPRGDRRFRPKVWIKLVNFGPAFILSERSSSQRTCRATAATSRAPARAGRGGSTPCRSAASRVRRAGCRETSPAIFQSQFRPPANSSPPRPRARPPRQRRTRAEAGRMPLPGGPARRSGGALAA